MKRKIIGPELLSLISNRINTISVLSGQNYRPYCGCFTCRNYLSLAEIFSGFSEDASINYVLCPKCGSLQQSTLRDIDMSGTASLTFYGGIQTTHNLQGKENVDVRTFLKEYRAIYLSAVIHFGGIRNAFKKIGVDYKGNPVPDWQENAVPLLGHMPPVIIAGAANVSTDEVRALGTKNGIGYKSPESIMREWINYNVQGSLPEKRPSLSLRQELELEKVSGTKPRNEPSVFDLASHSCSDRRLYTDMGPGVFITKSTPPCE